LVKLRGLIQTAKFGRNFQETEFKGYVQAAKFEG
jgi:hypothetical protein